MKKLTSKRALAALAAVVLVTGLLSAAPLNRDDNGRDAGRVSEPPVGDIGGPPRLPVPVDPPQPVVATGDFQLIGFSTTRLDGSFGVLNMTRTCQMDFPGSRMCTAGEISLTVNVPELPPDGAAWVQMRGSTLPQSTDCSGWTKGSPGETGMAIAMGQCYGGMVTRNCNMRLPVACCSASQAAP